MGGPDDVSQFANSSRWVLDAGLGITSPDLTAPQVGPSVEFTRRIPFAAGKLALSKANVDKYWTLDLGAGVQAGGWSDGRPAFAASLARVGLNYNLMNRLGAGVALRGGYASVGREDRDAADGFAWGGGFRFSALVTSLTFFSEIGGLSLPSAKTEGRDGAIYGTIGAGWLF